MLHLRAIELRPPASFEAPRFPLTVPALRNLSTLEFTTPITFFVGENGSGKSTLLECLACAIGSITVGTESVEADKTLSEVRAFARKHLKLTWTKKTRKGFFMRSEDFFGYARRLSEIREDFIADLREAERGHEGQSAYARQLAQMPYKRELYEMKQRYGESLDAYSHGESFFKLFDARFQPGGVYLLDEPEAPLSPTRQLAFLKLLKMLSEQQSQFIIATHAPIILAYPGATIYHFAEGQIRQTEYETLEHVTLTRDFLNHREQYLKHLWEG